MKDNIGKKKSFLSGFKNYSKDYCVSKSPSSFLLKKQKRDMSYLFKLQSKLMDFGPYSLQTPRKTLCYGENNFYKALN